MGSGRAPLGRHVKLSQRPSDELVAWAAERIPSLMGRGFPTGATAMGVETNAGELIGVVVFSEWSPEHGTIQVSAASIDPRWCMARDAFDTMWRYVFEVCGCQKAWAIVARSDERTLRFLRAQRMTFEAVLPRQLGRDDAVIARRFREDYIAEKRRISAHAA